MLKVYSEEFLPTLIKQATDLPRRYAPVSHKKLRVGDIVLIKDALIKRSNLPLARVEQVVENDLGEVTAVRLYKSSTREYIDRHVQAVIPLLDFEDYGGETTNENSSTAESLTEPNIRPAARPVRSAAKRSRDNWRQLASSDLL